MVERKSTITRVVVSIATLVLIFAIYFTIDDYYFEKSVEEFIPDVQFGIIFEEDHHYKFFTIFSIFLIENIPLVFILAN